MMTDWRLSLDPAQPRDDRWRDLPEPRMAGMSGPERYVAHEGLIDAVNTALDLGQPLLVTGDPGCGKTELGDFVAWKLGLGRAIRFDTRTDMQASDLFYSYDAVGRFHAAQLAARPEASVAVAEIAAVNFIRYHGLGEAIVRGSAPGRYERKAMLPPGFVHEAACRSVVLIDEIDKAARDVPNNLLRVMEKPCFTVPELGHRLIEAEEAFRPILILTSNSEKALPDAFLRRCIYYHMPFPDGAGLREIVANRLVDLPRDSGLVADAIALLEHLRTRRRLRKPPGVAEFLTFLLTLRSNGFTPRDRLSGRDRERWLRWARINLLKTREDQEGAEGHFDGIEWGRGTAP